jgi:hypothetical protein
VLASARPFAIANGAACTGVGVGEFTAEAIEERQWLRSVVRTYGKLEKT